MARFELQRDCDVKIRVIKKALKMLDAQMHAIYSKITNLLHAGVLCKP